MFYDWLSIYQDFDERLPFLSETFEIVIDTITGAELTTKQPVIKEEGSYCSVLKITITGDRIKIVGNPSRFNRPDNLFGLTTIEQCVDVYNEILKSHNLPIFTKGTQIFRLTGKDGDRVKTTSDGAVITEIHTTSNHYVGEGNADCYIKAISNLRYKNSIPRLHTNNKTCDWLTPKHNGGSIYPTVYNKAFELRLHSLTKIGNKYGADSKEANYVKKIIDFCNEKGVVRKELKIKSVYLRKNNLRFYGLLDESKFKVIHENFVNIDKKLMVEKMDIEDISDKLIREGICKSTQSANSTALYVFKWMGGTVFDLNNSSVQLNRARLRKVGIDIANVCDLTRFSPVYTVSSKEIVIRELTPPDWYMMPNVKCQGESISLQSIN